MKKAIDCTACVIMHIVHHLGVLVLGIMALASAVLTVYLPGMGADILLWRLDAWPIYVVIIIFVLVGVYCVSTWISGKRRGEQWLLVIVLGYITLVCGVLLVFGNTAPSGDSYSVYDLGYGFSQNSYYTAFAWSDSYLNYYPQQLGLAVYYEGVFRLCQKVSFPFAVYHVIKLFNIGFVLVTVICQWSFVKEFSKGRKASIYYLLMIPFCFPLFFYASFTYGEIPSLAFISLGCWAIQRLIEKKKVKYVFVTALAVSLSVLLRKNSLIFVIAAVIVLAVAFLQDKAWIYFVTAIVIVCAALGAPSALQNRYEQKAGADLSSGVSPWSYFAMGMQDSEYGAGFYNGYNFEIYARCKGDSEQIKAESQTVLKERMAYFLENPKELGDFYARKFLGQWMDGEYGCRKNTAVDYGNRHSFFDEVYEGKLSNVFIEFCSLYQFFIYSGVFFSLLCLSFEGEFLKVKTSYYIGVLTILGGVAFHLLWEAGTRYGFVYFILMIPYAALGFSKIRNGIE